ncbi:MAG TPA: CU044_5270 family protein [Actinoplanes sp.]|nr:CU044_5270 family protein [Actinoplanes sp.]
MKDTPTGLRAELAGLLPRPGDPRMSQRRLASRRADLLTAIEQPARSRVRRAGILIPALVVLVVAFGVAAVVRPWDRGVPVPIIAVRPGDREKAVAYLNGLAAAARTATGLDGGDGRYLYVKSRIAYVVFADSSDDAEPVRAELDALHDREIWKPLFVGGRGLLTEEDRPSDLGVFRAVDITPDLPEDPDAMLRKIYDGIQQGQGHSRDGQAFTVVGDLLTESMLSPRVTAALYQAAAKIPGVELVPDAVDAVGRPGIAVARTENSRRREWIFDEATGAYLGERAYLVEDTDYGRAGMLLATTAETERAVVGELGGRP